MGDNYHLEILFDAEKLERNVAAVAKRFPYLRKATQTRYWAIYEAMPAQFSEEDKQFLNFCIEAKLIQRWRCKQ